MRKKTISVLLFIMFLIPYCLGQFLYYLGKAIKALGYLLSFHKGSAKEEVREFLTFEYDISDL